MHTGDFHDNSSIEDKLVKKKVCFHNILFFNKNTRERMTMICYFKSVHENHQYLEIFKNLFLP